MFVITRSLGKFSGDRRLSDSEIPPAKAWFENLTTLSKIEGQSRQVRRGKKKILTNDFHP